MEKRSLGRRWMSGFCSTVWIYLICLLSWVKDLCETHGSLWKSYKGVGCVCIKILEGFQSAGKMLCFLLSGSDPRSFVSCKATNQWWKLLDQPPVLVLNKLKQKHLARMVLESTWEEREERACWGVGCQNADNGHFFTLISHLLTMFLMVLRKLLC